LISVIADPSAWAVSDSSCPSLIYTLIDTDTNAAATSIFVISSSTGYTTLQTNDKTKVKPYNLKLIATMTGYTKNSFRTFTVDIQDSCINVVIT
jgi:hypothetical protein